MSRAVDRDAFDLFCKLLSPECLPFREIHLEIQLRKILTAVSEKSLLEMLAVHDGCADNPSTKRSLVPVFVIHEIARRGKREFIPALEKYSSRDEEGWRRFDDDLQVAIVACGGQWSAKKLLSHFEGQGPHNLQLRDALRGLLVQCPGGFDGCQLDRCFKLQDATIEIIDSASGAAIPHGVSLEEIRELARIELAKRIA